MAPADSKDRGGSWYYSITAILTAIIALASTAYIVVQTDIFHFGDSESHQLSLPEIVAQIPSCIASCVFPRMVKYGCASSDYVCICETFDSIDGPVGGDTSWGVFQTCIEGCRNDALRAPSRLLDLCEAVDVSVFLPQFMRDQLRLHGRQFGSSSSIEFSPETSTPTPIATITSTQPWGVPASTSIQLPAGGSGTTTVLMLAADTSVSTFNTTKLARDHTDLWDRSNTPSKCPISLFQFCRLSSGAKTSTAIGTSSSNITTGKATFNAKPTGLSSGAKIGLGVAIPLVALAIILGAFLFFRRRRRRASAEIQETHDGGLPEHISAIPKAEKLPPQYPGYFSELGGSIRVPVHKMDQSHTPAIGSDLHKLNNDPASQRYEMNSDGTRATGYPTQRHFPPPPLADDNPETSARGDPISTSFPPPWEDTHGYPSHSSSVPIESESAPQMSNNPVHNSPNIVEDTELRELEREMAQIRDKKERLQQLQALESREEELRRTIEEKRRAGGRA
ncbi:hypothetical protein DL95DRAFT_455974 [Leptodontidium sp. 2 PMI_412]|nr:hypothetical protein DL95DRAFT_455974 [Leptodontidium sp. 2 PMI_412]